jgi:hypothetical protein
VVVLGSGPVTPLSRLRFDYRPDREDFVRSFKGLEAVNNKPAAEFWKLAVAPFTDAEVQRIAILPDCIMWRPTWEPPI